MIVKDFIRHIADGTYCKDDILNYANDSWDIKELIWDMKFATIAVADKLEHPLITDDKEIDRIDTAISLISKEFGVSLLDDDSSIRYKDGGVSTLSKPACKCILPDELIGEAVTKGSSENPKKRGRRSITFCECLTEKGKDMIEALHKAMWGKKGKDVALIIRVAVIGGLITKPTFQAVVDEFGDIGNRSGYNKYMSENYRFTDDEITGAKAQLNL